MPGPMSGVRILDVTQVVAGPLASQLLAEQGADVIKVEPPRGDMVRLTNPTHRYGLYANNNRGKRCLGIDLTMEGSAAILLRMAESCDVVFENFRPGVAERLGIGYDAVRAVNPDAIYCSISGFGDSGPYAERPALDPVIQALTGMVAGQRSIDLPFPDLIRTLVADKSTAYTAAQAITAALFARERGAGGQHLKIAMLDATLAFFWPDGMSDLTHADPAATGRRAPDLYKLINTTDGQVVYFIGNDVHLTGAWKALGRDDLLADDRSNTVAALRTDVEHAIAMAQVLEDALGAMSTAEAVEKMAANSVPCGPVLEREQVAADPQVVHNAKLVRWDHPEIGGLTQAGPAVDFSATPAELVQQLATVGEHNDELLAEFGYDGEAIADLRSRGLIT